MEHNVRQEDCYPGDPPHFERHMELDVEESVNVRGFGRGLTGTVISWTGIRPNHSMAQNSTNRVDSTPLDQTMKHVWRELRSEPSADIMVG
jgi:hypothetical protein